MLGESLHISVEYLRNEEKAVVANSKVNVLEVEASKLRKDPIIVMDGITTVKERLKVVSDELIMEKALMKQKDDQNQVFLLKVDEEK